MSNVVAERYLDARPDAVWSMLTSAPALEQWFWPPHFATSAQADLREGGEYRIASPVAGIAVSGRYLTIRAPEFVEFGWRWDGEELASAVAIELRPRDAGTGLVLTHSGLAAAEIGNHAQGWSDCLDRLPGYLAARPQG